MLCLIEKMETSKSEMNKNLAFINGSIFLITVILFDGKLFYCR